MARVAAYRLAHSALIREKRNDYSADWRARNPDKVKAYALAHKQEKARKDKIRHQEKKELHREQGKKWKQENRAKVRAYHKRYDAKHIATRNRKTRQTSSELKMIAALNLQSNITP